MTSGYFVKDFIFWFASKFSCLDLSTSTLCVPSDVERTGREDYWRCQRIQRQREIFAHTGEVLWSTLQQVWTKFGQL